MRQSLPISLRFSLLLQSGEQLSNIKEHTKQINDIQTSRDMTMFITASKDNTAKVSFSSSLWGFRGKISAQRGLEMFSEEGQVLNEQPDIEILRYFGSSAECLQFTTFWKAKDFPF